MLDREALHTAARRYCLERAAMWSERYAERPLGSTDPESLAIYPRYNVLRAILVAVERLIPSDFATLHELRDALVSAGQTAESIFTQPPREEVALRAIAEERHLFTEYIYGLQDDDLSEIKPLPYHRVLGASESATLWAKLNERWGIGKQGHWYPLIGEDLPSNVIAFQAEHFHAEVRPAVLQSILAKRGIDRVWELREDNPDYEIDLELFEPVYDGAEGYWTSRELDWIVYASHERSITIAGKWLITALKTAWPDWKQGLYTEWDY